MRLHPQGREFYTLTITTTPPVDGGWEASLDGGQTWHPGYGAGPDTWQWLVRGPSRPDDPDTPSLPVPRSMAPLVRAIDRPEILVRSAPPIYLNA